MSRLPSPSLKEKQRMPFSITPKGPFNLIQTSHYFGDWSASNAQAAKIGMAFPVEGWRHSAFVALHQHQDTSIEGEVYGSNSGADMAWNQALATLSLDVDGEGWEAVGERDPVIGALQSTYNFLRPVLFYSPYEAAAAFIIGHRITIQQGRTIRQAMAQTLGDKLEVDGIVYYAFPRP